MVTMLLLDHNASVDDAVTLIHTLYDARRYVQLVA